VHGPSGFLLTSRETTSTRLGYILYVILLSSKIVIVEIGFASISDPPPPCPSAEIVFEFIVEDDPDMEIPGSAILLR